MLLVFKHPHRERERERERERGREGGREMASEQEVCNCYYAISGLLTGHSCTPTRLYSIS